MEMMRIMPAFDGYDFFIVTERNAASRSIVAPYRHFFLMQQERRSATFAFRFLLNILMSAWIVIIERPRTIVCTGAGATYPMCRLGKLSGAKVIYIESFAKVDSPSVTGKMVYPFADHFLVQWPEMLKVYPKARHEGTVY